MNEEQHELRVAGVRAGSQEKVWSSGSGYLIAPTLVLTARHVVVDRSTGEAWSRIQVKVGHPRRPEVIVQRRASVCWWASDGRDVALLELDTPVEVGGRVDWGRTKGSEPLPYTGVGYPVRSKASNGESQAEQLSGKINPLTGGSGVNDLYALQQESYPERCPDSKWAWGGISGSAVFCRDRLVGVVITNNEDYGNSRLHAVPAHTFVTDPAFKEALDHHGLEPPAPVPVDTRPVARASSYLSGIEDEFTADAFEGRSAELEAMEAFCMSDDHDGPRYWRWLARAWSGKTALMAQFARHHKANLDVLAFFITRRHAAQSDRTAFLSAMQEQLSGYLADPDLPCAHRHQFLNALERAAQQATAAGRRLALLVDGLDEDTGVPDGSSGHSIAALLPRRPPHGLSILVAGRPNPPVPSDVVPGHPLHDKEIDHVLEVSPAARVAEQEAKRALKELWDGPWLGREVANLTAAASGGLSAADLASMARKPDGEGGWQQAVTASQVKDLLDGSAGRSFRRRPARWTVKGTKPEALFALGHDALYERVLDLLREDGRLDEYQARIHAYADQWRHDHWPTETPEYVLTGYPVLLRRLGDARRLTALATDPQRHERLFHTTGADARTLSQIDDAFGLHRKAPDPDLRACALLAYCRDTVRARAGRASDEVITTWARLGHARRAIALARSLHDYDRLVELLPRIVRFDPGKDTVEAAVDTVRSVKDPERQASALLGIVRAVAEAGCTDEAVTWAHEAAKVASCVESGAGTQIHMDLVRAVAGTGRTDDALALARDVADPDRRADALLFVVRAAAEAGRRDEAVVLAHEAATLARGVTRPKLQSYVLLTAARVVAEAGRTEEAVGLARTIAHSGQQTEALLAVVRAVAESGRTGEALSVVRTAFKQRRAEARALVARVMAELGRADDALALARTVIHPDLRAEALVAVARALVVADRRKDAVEVARDALGLVRDITDRDRRTQVMASLMRALVEAGDADHALTLAVTTPLSAGRDQVLAGLARALADVRRTDDALTLARMVTSPGGRAEALMAAARALVAEERGNDAVAVAQEAAALAADVTDPKKAVFSLVGAVCTAAEAGCTDVAVDLVAAINAAGRLALVVQRAVRVLTKTNRMDEAAALARAVTKPERRVEALTVVVRALAEAGRGDDAVTLAEETAAVARRITNVDRRADAMAVVAHALADVGAMADAAALNQEAAGLTRGVTSYDRHVQALVGVVRAVVQAGRVNEALTLAEAITKPEPRAEALAPVARALTEAGRVEEALALLDSVPHSGRRDQAMVGVVRALADAQHTERARELAGNLTHLELQAQALGGIVHALAEQKRVDEAEELARSISHADGQSRAMVRVVRALAEAGRTKEAHRLARSMPHGSDGWSKAGIVLARTAAVEGRMEDALSLAESIRPRDGAHAVAQITRVLAGLGRVDDAVSLAEKIRLPTIQNEALVGLARVVAEEGGIDDALALARRIPHPKNRAEALLAVARAPKLRERTDAAVALIREACALARTVPDPEECGDLLVDAALTIAEAGHSHDGADSTAPADGHRTAEGRFAADTRALLAEALSFGPRPLVAKALAVHAPEALRDVSALLTSAMSADDENAPDDHQLPQGSHSGMVRFPLGPSADEWDDSLVSHSKRSSS